MNDNIKRFDLIRLRNANGMEVEILTLGGIIKSIKTPDREGNIENVLIEYEEMRTYVENPGCVNALIGRTAGRIHKAQVNINDELYQFEKNDGNNTLHGGLRGFDKKIWESKNVSTKNVAAVELSCFSPDQEEGYPGNLEVSVTYSLDQEDTLTISYVGVSDQDTLVNLTNHAYFNLSGQAKRSIHDQMLMINGSQVCQLDVQNIPTGKLLDVSEHTVFDFRIPKAIGQDINGEDSQLIPRGGYDHPWILDGGQSAVTLYDPTSGRHMEISTDQKAVVVYSMNSPNPSKFTNGKENIAQYGITFETQSPPIGYNQCFKEDSLVLANETYTQTTSFKFTTR